MRTRAPMGAIALGVLALGGVAWAENECGAPEPGVEIVCSSSNYEPSGGNIFYSPDESNGDFTIRLTDDLVVDYDRDKPGDDVYIVPEDPENPRYSAVWITPGGSAYTGDISVFSSADVTSNARGISVGHYGESGSLRMELTGGHFTTMGERAYGIYSYHEGAGDIRIIARNLTVDTNGSFAHGIVGFHLGEGDLNIDVRDGAISTPGENADGIWGGHSGTGDVTINAQDLTVSTTGDNRSAGIWGQHTSQGRLDLHVQGGAISTTGDSSAGIIGGHFGTGDVTIDAQDLTVSTTGDNRAAGIFGGHSGTGDIDIDVQGVAITTDGEGNNGLDAFHEGTGNIDIDVQGGAIAVKGEQASGIDSYHRGTGDSSIIARNITVNTNGLMYTNAISIVSSRVVAGDINIDVRDATFMVTGDSSDGIFGGHSGTGDINVDAQGFTIAVNGTESNGVFGRHRGAEGDVNINVRGGRIATMGANSYGIYARHTNPTDDDDNFLTDSENNVLQSTGDITIGMTGGEISTQGDDSHGIFAEHESGMGEIGITVDGGSIHAGVADASGIQIGRLNEEGIVERAAALGEDGYRKQSVTVNGRVWGGTGEGSGVYLAGGGKLTIGPKGNLGAESGVAIRATGATLDSAGTTRKPKLYVDANLAGRRMARVIHGDIQNDGGKTTFLINGVTLHDGVTGATGLEVLNGAWDVTLRGREPIADRAFSANDVVEVYAPRAAVYEALSPVCCYG